MKYIVILLLLFVSGSLRSQPNVLRLDTSRINFTVGVYNPDESSITMHLPDSSFTIVGDKNKALRMMFRMLFEKQDEVRKLQTKNENLLQFLESEGYIIERKAPRL